MTVIDKKLTHRQTPDNSRYRQRTILRLPAVLARIGISRSSLYSAIKAGTFPDKIALGARAVGWDSAAVQDWIDAKFGPCGSTAAPGAAVAGGL
jgi:prophage regulatory protein